jgi:hypothetical protein
MSNKQKILGFALSAAVVLFTYIDGASQRRSGEAGAGQAGKPRIVVLATASNNARWTPEITTATLEDSLSQSGRFELITAAQRDKILSEQGFNNSDLVDPKQATRVGKLLSARYIIIGNAIAVSASKRKVPKIRLPFPGGSRSGDEIASEVETKVQIQMIDGETGVVKLSKTYEEKTNKDSITKSRSESDMMRDAYAEAMETIAARFTSEVGLSVPIEGLVVFVRGNRVAIDLGSDQSVQTGQEFEVYSEDEPIKNAAGEVLSYIKTKYARLRVAQVEPKLSWATVVETYDENGSPDPQPKLDRIKVNYAVRQLK